QNQLDQLSASGQLNNQELQRQLAEEQARNAQLDQELQKEKADMANLQEQIAKLSGQEHPEKEQPHRSLFALILSPGTERGGGQNPELKLSPGAASYSLKLRLEDDSFPSYTASLRALDGTEIALPGRLKAAGPRSARSITVTLPVRALRKGDYRLRLYGAAPQHEQVATYYFRVVE